MYPQVSSVRTAALGVGLGLLYYGSSARWASCMQKLLVWRQKYFICPDTVVNVLVILYFQGIFLCRQVDHMRIQSSLYV